jgi:hypothetical protein
MDLPGTKLTFDKTEIDVKELLIYGVLVAGGILLSKFGGSETLEATGAGIITTVVSWALGRMTTSKSSSETPES